MSDIKQAAKWLKSGLDVRRASVKGEGEWWLSTWAPRHVRISVETANRKPLELECDDLLADDWEPIE